MATLLWVWRLRIVFYMWGFCSYILMCNHSTNIYSLLWARHCRMHWTKWRAKEAWSPCTWNMYMEHCSWSKMTLKLKHKRCLRISQAERKQRVKQGEETALGRPWAKKALEISKNWKKANVIKVKWLLRGEWHENGKGQIIQGLHTIRNMLGFILRWWEGNTEFPPELWDSKISI